MRPGIQALQTVYPLTALPPGKLAELDEMADLARWGPDETLFAEGNRLTEAYFLLHGQVLAMNAGASGGRTASNVFLPVRPLGLPAALLGLPAPFTACTVTSVRVIAFPAERLRAFIHDNPAAALAFLDHGLTELHDLTREICDLKLRSTAQRLADYLLFLVQDPLLTPARFVLPFEKRLLAAKLGCSQENLSRAFARLRQVGVETQRGVVIITNMPLLREFSRTTESLSTRCWTG